MTFVRSPRTALGLALLGLPLIFPPPAGALRRARQVGDGSLDPVWISDTSCELAYYNVCTGWVWIWSNFHPGIGGWDEHDRVGVVMQACCDEATVSRTWTYFLSGSPVRYGHTMVSIRNLDESGCPTGPPLAEHFRMPVTGWNLDTWDIPVPGEFAIVQELRSQNIGHSIITGITTDRPAAVAGGPPACGTCYPVTRTTHSRYWGTPAEPLCPGVPFFDGTCDAEIIVSASLECAVAVEGKSWGSIKALYR